MTPHIYPTILLLLGPALPYRCLGCRHSRATQRVAGQEDRGTKNQKGHERKIRGILPGRGKDPGDDCGETGDALHD